MITDDQKYIKSFVLLKEVRADLMVIIAVVIANTHSELKTKYILTQNCV